MASIALGLLATNVIAQKQSAYLLVPDNEPAAPQKQTATEPAAQPEMTLALSPASMPATTGVASDRYLQTNWIASGWNELVPQPGVPSIATFHPELGSPFDIFGKIFDGAIFQFPLGRSENIHLHFPIDSDTPGVVVPYIDLLQDMDEVDAHIRNGIGVGMWYNLDRHTNIGIEGQYLDGSGDPNPVLSHETRMMIWISGQF